MTEHRCLLVFVLEASGTEICGEEAPHSEKLFEDICAVKCVSRDQEPQKRRNLAGGVSTRKGRGKWAWEGVQKEKLRDTGQRGAGVSGKELRTNKPADEEGLIPALSRSKDAYELHRGFLWAVT